MAHLSRREAVMSLAACTTLAACATKSAAAAPFSSQAVPETPMEPDLPIIDAHHHLAPNYTANDFVSDIKASGHNVVATVYVDCLVYYRDTGPEAMKPVGEVEFANGVAAQGSGGIFGSIRPCSGIVGHVDLTSDLAPAVLDAQMARAGDRLKGIRCMAAWDADPTILGPLAPQIKTYPHYYADERFRTGFRHLAKRGLSFDAWVLEPQLEDVLSLARAFPDTQIILDHVGGPVGIGAYQGRLTERFGIWRKAIREIAKCPNVVVKLGGLGEAYQGLRGPGGDVRLSSQQLASNWRPYLETSIEAFGVKRAMFESDFQVEKAAMEYVTLWNAFKRVAAGASADEKRDLFYATAQRVYRLTDLA